MRFLFLPRNPRALSKAQSGTKNWKGGENILGIFSDRMLGLAAELGQKPGAGHFPVPHHGVGGNFDYFRSLLNAQAGEKAKLDDAGFAWVDFCQGIESVVESDEFTGFGLGDVEGLGEIERLRLAPALGRQPAARAIEQDAPHQGGRNGEEMGAMLPIELAGVDQAQIDFVNQLSALQAVARALVLEQAGGQAAQLAIYTRG